MNRFTAFLSNTALVAGALALAWAGWATAQHHPLALGMTALIAAFYALGAWELRAYRRASLGFQQALDGLQTAAPASAEAWVQALPAPVRAAVRQRLQGLPAAWQAPALAPALAALLVLLGMLGTFIGLVQTLGGTAQALRATADLAAMRAALTTPVQGLGLAFGCSVAGVAGSAMLGLMSALARRERAATAQGLEAALAGPLQPWTAAARQQATQAALEQQAQALPQLVSAIGALSTQLSQQQQQFHEQTAQRFTALAESVDASLRQALGASAQQAADTLRPAVQSTLDALATQAGRSKAWRTTCASSSSL
ncbi:MAG: hypothetical protein U1E77_11925 [Inhella sp.]